MHTFIATLSYDQMTMTQVNPSNGVMYQFRDGNKVVQYRQRGSNAIVRFELVDGGDITEEMFRIK